MIAVIGGINKLSQGILGPYLAMFRVLYRILFTDPEKEQDQHTEQASNAIKLKTGPDQPESKPLDTSST
jgi:hypothetical protein